MCDFLFGFFCFSGVSLLTEEIVAAGKEIELFRAEYFDVRFGSVLVELFY